ncbi:MAG: ABC transporter ATP-binding protein [Pirellulales bacterium]|nr:ABC transporter ATP-binding protein [Pirellulales bacterium]
MTALQLDHVTKIYPGGVRAVEEVSFDLAPGQRAALVGPSGAGKTTILRLIAGLETVSRGQILLAGRDVTRLSPRRRNVAMVFQQTLLYPHLRVYGNLAFALKMRGAARSEIDHRVREAAEWLGIGDLLHRRPWELSGGQQQRVALGRALVRRPQLFLLDEPLAHLDPELRGQLREEILRVQQRLGTAMLYVTHDPMEAQVLGQRILTLRNGGLMG